MISNETIDRILDLDIVTIIENEGVKITTKGASRTACCPFHHEKTPSFHVHVARNMYKCFGCGKGGNAISFIRELKGMTFVEAVEYLANRYGIPIDKEQPSPEEMERRFRKEKLFKVNAAAIEFFRSRLIADTPVGKHARAYCEKRGWADEDTWKKMSGADDVPSGKKGRIEPVDEFQMGYAPEDNSIIGYLNEKGFGREVLLAAGLIRKNEDRGTVYSTFRGRIMFPIFDKSGNAIAFTGRYIYTKDEVPKYLNSPETEIFKKDHVLFGQYQGYRRISTTSTVFLMEGNPDVIRLHAIGQANAVASLGTALSSFQIDEMKKKASMVVMIGDNDEAGQKAVIKNGERMIKEGLRVRVMELPRVKKLSGEEKAQEFKDADEYFKTFPGDFDDLHTQAVDFIPWYTAGKMKGKSSQSEISQIIKEVCQIMAHCSDENAVAMYIDEFSQKYKHASIWKSELFNAKGKIERSQMKSEGAEDMLAEYGFYVKNNCYCCQGEKGGEKHWSNFTMRPILHIRDEKNAKRIFLIVNCKGEEAVVKLNQSEMVSFADFKTRTESAGNYVWEAGQQELTSLKRYLYDGTPSADEIKQLGWQKKFGFYAWGNGGFDGEHFERVDKFGIVTVKGSKFYLPGNALDTQDNVGGYQQMRKFVYTETNDISLLEFCTKLIEVFGDNAKVAICFLLATLFRDIIVDVTTSFPILNLFGPKGTGKSELGHALTAFFVTNYKAPNINNATKAALAEAVAEVSNAIVHLDEYKNNIDIEKREFLKGIWDGAGRSRMNMDNDKKRETTAVDSGVVMSGQEMPTADIALFSRLLFLKFTKSEFSEQERRNFENLQILEKRGLTHLTLQILKHRSYFLGHFRDAWDEVLSELNQELHDNMIEDRTLKNWAIILSAFKCLVSRLELPMTYPEMLSICVDMCNDQNSKTKQNNELSGFWECVDTLVSSARVLLGADYRIEHGNGREMKIKEGDAVLLDSNKSYLYINFNRIAFMYTKQMKDGQGKAIPPESLKFYLEHSAEFMGTKPSMRFDMIENPNASSTTSKKQKVTSAMVFDYTAIKEHYDIDINIDPGDETTSAKARPSLL